MAQTPRPNNQGIEDIGAEDLSPKGGPSILGHLLTAEKFQANGERLKWQNEVETALLEAKKAKFASDEKHWKEEQKLLQEKRILEEKLNTITGNQKVLTDIRNDFDNGNYERGLLRMATLQDTNAQLFSTLVKYLMDKEAGKGEYAWIAQAKQAGATDRMIETLFWQRILKRHGIRNPSIPHGAEEVSDIDELDLGIGSQGYTNAQDRYMQQYEDDLNAVNEFITQAPIAQRTQTPPRDTYYSDMHDLYQFLGQKPTELTETLAAREQGIKTEDKLTGDAAKYKFLLDNGILTKEQIADLEVKNPQSLSGDTALYDWALKNGILTAEQISKIMTESGTVARDMPFRFKEYLLFKQEILDDRTKSDAEKQAALDELDARYMNSSQQNFASRLNIEQTQRIEKLSTKWGAAHNNIFLRTQSQSIPSQNMKLFSERLETILSSDLSEMDKNKQIFPLVQSLIVGETATSDVGAKRVEAYRNIITQARTVEDHIKQPRSRWDLNRTGFINSTILNLTGMIGHVLEGQQDLAEIDITNKATLQAYIQSVSGLAVTDSERKFLASVLFDIGDGQNLTEAKINGWRNLVGKYLTRYYRDYLGDMDLGKQMTQHLIGNELPDGYFDADGVFHQRLTNPEQIEAKVNQLLQNNPNISIEEILPIIQNQLSDTLDEAGRQRIIQQVQNLVTGTYDKVATFINDNTGLDINQVYQQLAMTVSTENLDELQKQITNAWTRVKGNTGQISQRMITKVKNIKALEQIDMSVGTVEQFIESVRRNHPNIGLTNKELTDIYNRGRSE